MTNEEKKAISLLKSYENKLVYEISDKDKKAVKILLNLIDKQQKEIEDLKEITKMYDTYIGEEMPLNSRIMIADRDYFVNGTFVKKFISKDTIRNKITELSLKNKIPIKDQFVMYDVIRRNFQIEILEDLLKEE